MNRICKNLIQAVISTCRNPTRLAGFWLPSFLLLASLFAGTGCTSKAKADSEARNAFLVGQQQGMMRMQQSQVQGPVVTVQGRVHNPTIPWSEGLTVAKAIVAADYYGVTDPREIIVVRQGFARRVDPSKLLLGEDLPLQPGDLMEIR